jgi:hypothetical protein
MLAGRPHETAGNGSPRWMTAASRPREAQNPAYRPAHPIQTLLTCGGAIANRSRGTCPVPETTSAHIMPGLRRIQSAGALRQVLKDALERAGAMLASAAD